MRDVARKGDLAYVLPYSMKNPGRTITVTESDKRSRMVKVLSNPELAQDFLSFNPGDIINLCEMPSGIRGWIRNAFLVPIRNPDAATAHVAHQHEPA